LFTLLRILLVVITSLVLVSPADAQIQSGNNNADVINWWYSATFGTGVYTSGSRSVAVLQLPFSHSLKSVDEDNYGLKFKVATTLGFYDYNVGSALNGNIPDRLSTFSVLPGFELELPMTQRWVLRPFADAGFGQELSGHESAWIFDFGVRSRFLLAQNRGVDFVLVNSLTSAGYRPRGESTNTFGYFATGVDITIPTERSAFGRQLYFGFTPVYFYYFNKFSLAEFNDRQNRIREEFELALSVVTRKPWSLSFLDFDRLGFAIRSSGDVIGVSVFTSLPF
jgi:hypothetical protein